MSTVSRLTRDGQIFGKQHRRQVAIALRGHSQSVCGSRGEIMSALPPKADMCSALAYVCFGPKADIILAAVRSENSSSAGHRCRDTGEIAPGQAWLGCDHLGPNNEQGRDHDEDSGQLLAHCSRFPL